VDPLEVDIVAVAAVGAQQGAIGEGGVAVRASGHGRTFRVGVGY